MECGVAVPDVDAEDAPELGPLPASRRSTAEDGSCALTLGCKRVAWRAEDAGEGAGPADAAIVLEGATGAVDGLEEGEGEGEDDGASVRLLVSERRADSSPAILMEERWKKGGNDVFRQVCHSIRGLDFDGSGWML
jgi:hypothetical protein